MIDQDKSLLRDAEKEEIPHYEASPLPHSVGRCHRRRLQPPSKLCPKQVMHLLSLYTPNRSMHS